jgi:uncharacterized protein DUF6166
MRNPLTGHQPRPDERLYVGERGPAGGRVWVVTPNGVATLPARRDEPLSSFGWGRHGTLARELAWAMLHDCTGDRRIADDWCGDLGREIVGRLPREAFSLDANDLVGWLEASCPAALPAPRAQER